MHVRAEKHPQGNLLPAAFRHRWRPVIGNRTLIIGYQRATRCCQRFVVKCDGKLAERKGARTVARTVSGIGQDIFVGQ